VQRASETSPNQQGVGPVRQHGSLMPTSGTSEENAVELQDRETYGGRKIICEDQRVVELLLAGRGKGVVPTFGQR